MALKIADKEFTSRLFTGTGKFASNQLMEDAILASESQLVTVALKRMNMDGKDDDILAHLKAPHITLLPNTSGVRTAKEAVFVVLPYIQADPVLCKHLENAGAATVMPLGAPIGTNKGLVTRDLLEIIIEQSNVPVIVDAGIGAPSHAAAAMEMGAAAVLVNTAIAVSPNPVEMGRAFKLAVEAGRMAFEAKLAKQYRHAQASSPLTAFLD